MPIEFSCAGCGSQLRVPDHAAGKKAQCPSCDGLSVVPHPELTGQEKRFGAATPPVPAPAFEQPQPMSTTDPLQETVYHQRDPATTDGNPAERLAPSALAQANPFAAPLSTAIRPREKFLLASRWQRLAGRLLDWGFTITVGAVAVASLALLMPSDFDQTPAGEAIFGGLALICWLVIPAVNWWLIWQSGQTLGKKVVGTRIVLESNGAVPGFIQGVAFRTWLPGFLSIAFFPIFGFVDAIFIVGEKVQCLHDLFASTRVVRTR